MRSVFAACQHEYVALHPEGVDRNMDCAMRKAPVALVALHPEGVDRNIQRMPCILF